MALFGKKKKAEPMAAAVEEQDEILVVGGDADEFGMDDENDGGQAIDFDAIADELGDDNGESMIGAPLNGTTATVATPTGDFGSTADFSSGDAALNTDDDLDFDAVFNDGTPSTPAANAPFADAPFANDNPFGVEAAGTLPAGGGIAIEPENATPPMTYTAPLLTSDAVATTGVPATRKSLPLPMILGALGLLLALGAVSYLVTQGGSTPDPEPVIATNPPRRAGAGGTDLVNLGTVVDGVPIAPGANSGIAPALVGPKPTVPLTPELKRQLKVLWNRGAAAKQRGDIAGARAAWMEMLRRRPNHPLVQSAIDKLPAA